jgi:hypothetical protein
MAMRTATPWGFTWVQLFGLLLVFVGERLLDAWPTVSTAVAWLGAGLVLGVLAVRLIAVVMTPPGSRRQVERTLLLSSIGLALALVAYLLSTRWGMQKLVGIDDLAGKGAGRWQVAMQVATAILAALSVLPMVMIESVLGTSRRERLDLRSRADDDGVEYRRVREVGLSGVTVALAAALLMVTCNVARQRNLREDVSYFKTSEPGTSTVNILRNTSEPVKVMLFYPSVNPVKDQLRAYFEQLGGRTGKVEIEEHDPEINPALANKFGLRDTDAAVVLMLASDAGDAADKPKHEKIPVDRDIDIAKRGSKATSLKKPTLRVLDQAVNAALMKLVRDKRVVYWTIGHGEINDPDSLDPDSRVALPDAAANYVKFVLNQQQHYEVKPLGAMQGLDSEVPEDATMVLVLGPVQAFLPDELDTLARYLDRGGHLLLALDPLSPEGWGPLETRLGVRFVRTPLLDDQNFDHYRGPRVPFTDQFTTHASIPSVSAVADAGIRLLESGSLDELELDEGTKRTPLIRSMTTTFRDVDGDGKFTDGLEKRDRYIVAAAVEGPPRPDGGAGFRAIVFGDVHFFVDKYSKEMGQVRVTAWGGPLVGDTVRWLGGEEAFAGDIVDENDAPIDQTHKQQSWWFLLTIVGAPLLVLTGGLVGTRRRRRRAAPRRSAVTPAAAAAATAVS